MIELKINVSEKMPEHFQLGRQGENRVRQIVFDVRPWLAKYGEGVVSLIAQRSGDAAPYPVAITVESGLAAWLVSNADTAMAGYGHAELRLTVGNAVKKSKIYTFDVQETLGPVSAHPPQPYQGWVDEVLQAGAQAQNAAQSAEQSASAARRAAEMFPTGGTTGQILAKASDANYDTHWIDNEGGGGGALPPGGTDGQYLVRSTDAQAGAIWRDLPIFDGSYEVTPLPYMETIMQTQRTYLDRDIVVKEIPYAEVTNEKGGLTATIGG